MVSGIAYRGLFSVFAALAIGISILMASIGQDPEMRAAVVESINTSLPGVIDDGDGSGLVSINTLVMDSAINLGSIVAAVALLLSALGVMDSIKVSLRAIFGIALLPENPLLSKLRDLVTFIVMMLGVVATAVAQVLTNTLGETVLETLNLPPSLRGYGLRIAAILAALVIDAIVLSLVIRSAGIGAPRKDLFWGCIIGAVGFGALRVLGTSAVGSVSGNPILASFAAIIVLLLWLNLAARILLYTAAWIANPPAPVKTQHVAELHAKDTPNYVTHSALHTLIWPHNGITGVLHPDPRFNPGYHRPGDPQHFGPRTRRQKVQDKTIGAVKNKLPKLPKLPWRKKQRKQK